MISRRCFTLISGFFKTPHLHIVYTWLHEDDASESLSSNEPYHSEDVQIEKAMQENHVDIQQFIESLQNDNMPSQHLNPEIWRRLQKILSAWNEEKQAMQSMVQAERKAWEERALCALKQHVRLEKDHQALKEELENTKSLIHKAGLGIRLSARNVRELSNGDKDLRYSGQLPPSTGNLVGEG